MFYNSDEPLNYEVIWYIGKETLRTMNTLTSEYCKVMKQGQLKKWTNT